MSFDQIEFHLHCGEVFFDAVLSDWGGGSQIACSSFPNSLGRA